MVRDSIRAPRKETLRWSVASYQGRLYGDLGCTGVLLGSILLGLGSGALYRWARSKSGLVAVALVAYVFYYSAFMVYDNLISFTVIAGFDLVVITLIARYVRGDMDEAAASVQALWRRGAAA